MEHIDISSKLKELLTRHSMNLKEFSEFVGVSRTSLIGYINGNVSPTIEPLVKICNRCNVSLDWLCSTETDYKMNTIAEIISYFLNLNDIDQFSYELSQSENKVTFEIMSSGNSVSCEIYNFIVELLDIKERIKAIPDEKIAKDYFDMWLEKKLAYYATMPVHTKNEDEIGRAHV